METLKYIVEDKTIAKLLGTQNFSTDESAVLELVKNAYDANATKIVIEFLKDKMIICLQWKVPTLFSAQNA